MNKVTVITKPVWVVRHPHELEPLHNNHYHSKPSAQRALNAEIRKAELAAGIGYKHIDLYGMENTRDCWLQKVGDIESGYHDLWEIHEGVLTIEV